jgi:3-hydroxyisobutyrate dehydrogenase-like beta-hydroxyacid dehydrogenase
MLLGGPHARDFLAAAEGLGFRGASAYSEVVGQAAATKLCRSVMIKGVEALLTESLLAARRYGVEQVVLDSLSDLLPLPDWNKTAQYMISRSLAHGTRRAEEMREAARMVAEAGVAPLMSEAIAERQDRAAAHGSAMSDDLGAMLDAINKRLGERG